MSNIKRDYTFIKLPEKINTNFEKLLSPEELEYDKEQILYALKNSYSGQFVPGSQYKNLLKDIRSIQSPITVKSLCEILNEHFSRFPDQHLKATRGHKSCIKKEKNGEIKKTGNVGKNYYEKDYHEQKNPTPWNVKFEKKNDHTVLLISIMTFPLTNSPVWDGFLDRVQKFLPKAHFVIIDLRGNNGGSDGIGFKLSKLLAGVPLKTPYKEQKTVCHPASFQLIINTMEMWSLQFTRKDKELSHIKGFKNILIRKRDKLIKGESVSLHDLQGEESLMDFQYEKSIKKPIYILMDSQCGSSCESTIDFFEFNPLVKTVGENTFGSIHFGNNGTLVLKNSGVSVHISISYNQYHDGRFIEKTGITPKIRVPSNQNAMSYAWKDFLKNSTSTKKN